LPHSQSIQKNVNGNIYLEKKFNGFA